jgi:predicted methyltransferase
MPAMHTHKFDVLAIAATLVCACAGSTPTPTTPHAAQGGPTEAADVAVAPSPGAPAAASAPSVAIDPARYRPLLDATDRSEDDRKLDAGRMPAELLAFVAIEPGMKVAEISAGGGYTSEFLARAVGPNGVVYAQNSPWVLQRFAEKPWSERLQKPVMKNVVRVDREFDDPLPSTAHDLNAVVNVLFYHDTVWQRVDRDRMNRAIFAALKPGGEYVIVDHESRAGAGTADTETLHRIEGKVVREEIERAGFKFSASADFLRNPSDTHDWNASPMAAGERRGTSDRFVYKFIKP